MCPSFLDTSFSLCFFISWVSFDPFNLNLDVLHSSALMSHVSITRLCLLISSPSLISWWHTVFPRSFLLFEHLFPEKVFFFCLPLTTVFTLFFFFFLPKVIRLRKDARREVPLP
ncbi:hypothetical protein HCH54_005791 [Aspergillus fumigatus]